MLTGEEDMSIEKPNGKTQAPEPVESIGWFGDVFISSKISGQLSPNCNREPRELHEKNPRIPRGPRSKNLSSKLNVLSSPNEKREPREAA